MVGHQPLVWELRRCLWLDGWPLHQSGPPLPTDASRKPQGVNRLTPMVIGHQNPSRGVTERVSSLPLRSTTASTGVPGATPDAAVNASATEVVQRPSREVSTSPA